MNELKIGERIANLRTKNNITQAELAEKLGVTYQAVSKWETGSGYPDITMLPDIADAFGVSLDYLLRGKPRLRQKLDFFYPHEGGQHNCNKINVKYLDQGWQVASVTLVGDGTGGTEGVVVVQKECYDD